MDERMTNFVSGDVVDTEGIFFQQIHHCEPFDMAFHEHEEAHFALLLSGQVESEVNGSKVLSGESTFSYMPPQTRHASRYMSEAIGFYVSVRASTFERTALLRSKLFCRAFDVIDGPIAALGRSLYEEYRRCDAASKLIMEGMMIELFDDLSSRATVDEGGRIPTWLTLAREYLHDHSDSAISIGQLASEIGIHPVHLMRTFRKVYGLSIGSYVRQTRLSEACRRLRMAPWSESIGDISCDLGFADQQHFSRVFREYLGMSPSDFRRRSLA
ncbi:MAG: helix-turn-helix domain-containing protein [Armatimonadetes bacterium]|nr:helix-turn-helix domain-containing protein [Armatimonadota bacterium]